ncbi:MAG: HlyD family efflux transporter periplasmic adaptor subunit [Betaproteobacteria bacterium]|nr:HlyD family efflux transporter periplasmic adaptor subunit [Betaproteobacteria bacterium]
MKKSIVAVLVVVLLAAGTFWYFTRPKADADQFTLYGNVDIRQVSLAFESSDRVAEMRVQEGDPVKAGQVLALLDTRVLALQAAQSEAQIGVQEQALLKLRNGSRPEEIGQARAQVASAQADADLAAQQLTRLNGIAASTGGKGVSQQDMDSALSKARSTQAQLDNRRKALQLEQVGPRKEDIGQAEAQLNVSRAELALLKHRIAQAELKSPQDAVVRARLLEPGDMASPQRPAYTLAITDPKWVRVYITEPQLGLLKPGQRAKVTTDSHPDQAIDGQVGYISSVAEFTPKNVETKELRTSLVYEVRVLVKDPQNRLRLGMPATVQIDARGAANPPTAAQ